MLLRGFGAMNGLRGAFVYASCWGVAGAPWYLGRVVPSGSSIGAAAAAGASARTSRVRAVEVQRLVDTGPNITALPLGERRWILCTPGWGGYGRRGWGRWSSGVQPVTGGSTPWRASAPCGSRASAGAWRPPRPDRMSWHITRRGFWRRIIQATDAADSVVGEFEPRGLRRGGALRWAGRRARAAPGEQVAGALRPCRRRARARRVRRKGLGAPARGGGRGRLRRGGAGAAPVRRLRGSWARRGRGRRGRRRGDQQGPDRFFGAAFGVDACMRSVIGSPCGARRLGGLRRAGAGHLPGQKRRHCLRPAHHERRPRTR